MIQELTPHDQACIALKVPQSSQSELNDLIRDARRLDMTQAAVVSMSSKLKTADGSPFMTDTHLHRELMDRAREYAYTVLHKDD